MNKTLKTFLLIFSIFFIIIFLVTFGLLNGYFEQDEWLGIAEIMRSYSHPWWVIFIPAQIHFSPVGELFYHTLYGLFKLQAQYYFIAALIIHSVVSTLVYFLANRITNNKIIALITGLFFLLNGRAHQAFTHLAIFHTTTTALMLILIFFVYASSIKDKVLSFKNTVILFAIFLAAAATREEGIIIIPISLAYLLTFGRGKLNIKNIKYIVIFLLGVFSFLLIRLFAQTLYTNPIPIQYQITGSGASYNLLTLPIKFIIQNLINYNNIAVFLLAHTDKIYPDVTSYFASQAPIMDAAFFYIFGIMSSIVGLWIWTLRPKRIGLILGFCLAWIGSDAFMLSFVGRHISVIEPRYLYFSSFPVILIFVIFAHSIYTSKSKINYINFFKKISIILLLIVLLITSIQQIRTAVDYMSHSGKVKREVFNNLLKVHPKLSKNTIFFIKCIIKCYRNSDLGIPNENVLPFSSGPGMNILVYYASKQGEEKQWGPFFTNEFLFQIYSEDYKRIRDRSFGYFVTKSKLIEALKKNNLPTDVVVALEVDESNYTFRDISQDFRKTLEVN